MAQRTRGETLLNAYMNRYVNDQSSAVNRGQKNIQNAATVGSNAISAVPTDLPELTDFSSEIYSGLLENEKERQKLYEESVKAAQEAAKKAAKAAASSGKSSSGKSSSGKRSSGGTNGNENAELPQQNTENNNNVGSETTENNKTEENGSKSKKPGLFSKIGNAVKDFFNGDDAKETSTLDLVREKKDKALGIDRKSSAGSKIVKNTGVPVGSTTTSKYATTPDERKRIETERKESREKEEAKNKAEQQTAYANLSQDPSYAEQLSQPGVRLDKNQIKAVNQYLDEQPSRFELAKQYRNGELSYDEYSEKQLTIDRLKQKVQFGGIGQDIQAFGAGLFQGIAPAYDVLENVVDDATGGKYSESIGGQTVSDVLDSTSDQNKIASVGGNIAGTMLGYGAANAALEGTKIASAAGKTGSRIAAGLSELPGVGNLVTPGTGQAIGNILLGQGTDVALDTIPHLAEDVYNYATDNPENLTPVDIAGRTAGNFALNAALNVGSEAVPALWNAGRKAISRRVADSSANLNASIDELSEIPSLSPIDNAPATDRLVAQANAETQADNAIKTYRSIPSLDEGDTFYPQWVQAQTAARQAELGLEIADTPESIARNADNLEEAANRLNQIYNQEVAIRRLRESSLEVPANPVYNESTDIPGLEVNYGTVDAGNGFGGVESVGTGNRNADVPGGRAVSTGNQRVFRQPVIDDSGVAEVQKSGSDFVTLQDTTENPELFTRALEDARQTNKHGLMVSGKTIEEATAPGTITFMGEDGLSGALVTADGDIEAVFKNPASKTRRASTSLLLTAVENGGIKLDCYGKSLVRNYNTFGFEPVARVPFDPQYAPEGWTYGPQDVYVMKLQDGLDANQIANRMAKTEADGGFHKWTQAELDALPEMDYDSALAYRDSLIKSPSANAGGVFTVPADSMPSPSELPSAQAGSIPELMDSAASTSGSVPELDTPSSLPNNAVGAKRMEYPIGDIVQNQTYANQNAVRKQMDEAHSAQINGPGTHRVWTDAEAERQATDDIQTAIQTEKLNGGDMNTALDGLVDDLKRIDTWDKGDTKRAQQVRNMMVAQYNIAQEGTPEFYKQAARVNQIVGMIDKQGSKSGGNLQSFHEKAIDATTGIRKMRTAQNTIVGAFEENNAGLAKKYKEVSEQLEALKNQLSDVQAKETAGPMDNQFDAFLKDQNVKTDPTAEFEDIVNNVRNILNKNKVKTDDETIKMIAGQIQAGEASAGYYDSLMKAAAGISDLTPQEMKQVDDIYRKIADMPDNKERYKLESQVIQIMASHLPAKSFFERIDNLRYLAMLGNSRTHVRNILGNISNSVVLGARDKVTAAYQVFLPKENRTKAIFTPPSMKKAAMDYAENNAYSLLKNQDISKFNLDGKLDASKVDSRLLNARKTYNGKTIGRVFEGLSKANSKALEAEDYFFMRGAFSRSLASELTAKGYGPEIFKATDEKSKTVLANAVSDAFRDAQASTFRSDNLATKVLGQLGNLGDKTGSLPNKILYMLSSGLLPFTKTTANIAKTSLEFTPPGALVQALYRAKHKNAPVSEAIANGTIGAGLMYLGWWLADNGILTANVNEDTKQYDQMLGKQSYSLNIPGKGSYTIDWGAPMVIPTMMGVELQSAGIDLSDMTAENFDLVGFAGRMIDVFSTVLNPFCEMSLMQGVNKTLEDLRYNREEKPLVTIGKNLATSYAQQFVPSVAGQIARSVDPLRRSTYGGGDTRSERDASYQYRSFLNKIPGLSMENEPYIDQWGRTEASLDGTGDDADGVAARLAYNMFSPGYFSAENVTPVDELVQRLYDQTGDKNVIPELSPSYVSVDGKDQYFTPEQKTAYAQASGQLSYNMLDELRSNSFFTGLPADEQADIVSQVYDLAGTVGSVSAIPSLDTSDDDAYSVYKSAGTDGAIDFFLSKNAYNNAIADKKASTGNENASLTDYEKWNAVSSIGLDDSAAIDAYMAQLSDDSSIGKKVQQIGGQYGASTAADFLTYMYNYSYAKDVAQQQAKAAGESADLQWTAQSVLDQLGYDESTKRLFWQMTDTSWKSDNNPF